MCGSMALVIELRQVMPLAISKTLRLGTVEKMARLTREQLFTPDEMAIVHVMNRAVRHVS